MLKKLKRRFTALCTVLTGSVLAVACLLAYNMAKSTIVNNDQQGFDIQSDSLGVLLSVTRVTDAEKIRELEKGNGVCLYVFENETALQLKHGYDEENRLRLYDKAMEQLGHELPVIVGSDGHYDFAVTISSRFDDGGQEYYTKYMYHPTGEGNWYTTIVIKPVFGIRQELDWMKLLYAGIFAGGLALLALISLLLAKRSVRPVEAAQAKQKEFIAAASHELKSPLAVIVSSADLITCDKASEQAVTNIRSEAKRAGVLVEDLQESLPVIPADPERILQILSVLLSNAVGYQEKKGEILLEGLTRGNRLVLKVTDQGPGIPDEEKSRVFDSFYRRDSGRSDKNHFGLGLAVARELVQLHGGSIRIENTPGGGASFVVELPLESE